MSNYTRRSGTEFTKTEPERGGCSFSFPASLLLLVNYTLNSQIKISSVPRTVFVFVSCEERLLLCRHGRTAPFWLPLLLRTQPPYARVGMHVWKLKEISVFFPPLSFLSFLALLCHFLFFSSLCVILRNLEAGKSSRIWVIWFRELTRFFINPVIYNIYEKRTKKASSITYEQRKLSEITTTQRTLKVFLFFHL